MAKRWVFDYSEHMKILGMETSCDETAAAVVTDGKYVDSNIISSLQADFSATGGVIPEDAARKQLELIQPVIQQALTSAEVSWQDIDAIAVTKGPGLLGSLLIGVTAARIIASIHQKPLIGIHHTLGHLSSTWLERESSPLFPCLTLSASGGHSELWYRKSHSDGELIGQTRDDAAGEAFDKSATMLQLPYPGGPSISTAAIHGDEQAYELPMALRDEKTLDFSFSGLKTALKYTIRDQVDNLQAAQADLAASIQYAICQQLVDRLKRAVELYPDVHAIHIVGGVSANQRLRELLHTVIPQPPLLTPVKNSYCTDNAAMIACAAYYTKKSTGHQERFETSATPSPVFT